MTVIKKCSITPIFLDIKHNYGNKYYKLKYNLLEAKRKGYTRVITFGGAWSNSVHALANIGAEIGFETIAVIRGERPLQLSLMLKDVEALGMSVHFVSRADYRRRDEAEFLDGLMELFHGSYLLPEGGTNLLAVQGTREIVADVDASLRDIGQDYDLIALPVATGGTLAGIATALPAGKRVLGISVLKGTGPEVQPTAMQIKAGAPRILAAGLETDIAALIDAWWAQELGSAAVMPRPNWSIDHRFHCGGYARCPAYLREFILGWEAEHGAQLDPVYTGKLFYALAQMHEAGEFSPGTRIVALHTGGGQGRRGFNF